MQIYEYEAKELLGLLDGLNSDEAVKTISNYINAKVEGALEAVDDYRDDTRFWSE